MSRNISELHPRLQQKIAELQALCKNEGLALGIGECFRSVAEQDALYAQGRTKAGNIVTNAKGSTYSSQHQWGIAFDFFKNIKGQEFSDGDFFNRVGKLAKSIGLGWGGDWKNFVDKPHLYLPDWGSTTSTLKSKYGSFEKFKSTWNVTSITTPIVTSSKFKIESNVKSIQVWLNTYYNCGLVIDGSFGSKTKKALIKAWQTEVGGLEVDGSFGRLSQAKASSNNIKKNNDGILVTIWQACLVCKGYNPNGIDGHFGNGCHSATLLFQKNNSLMVDGVVGKSTWTKIFR